MISWDAVGYLASTLVLTAFGMKDVVPLRVVAIFSNLAFIVYGLGLDLMPVWSLHAALLPLNGLRLLQARRSPRKLAPNDPSFGPRDNRQISSLPLARAA